MRRLTRNHLRVLRRHETRLADRPGASQSQVRVGHLGSQRKTPDYAAARLLEMVLGGSFTSHLNQNLRSKHGYVYHAYAKFDLGSAAGLFRGSFARHSHDPTADARPIQRVQVDEHVAPVAHAGAGRSRTFGAC